MIQTNTLQDKMIASYIDQVFNKYDQDRNGTLDIVQMTLFFNDLFQSLNINTVVTQAQAHAAILSIDQNSDGMVSKEELFKAFKLMLNPPQQNNLQPPYNPPQQNYNSQPNYNPQPNYNTGYSYQQNVNPYSQYPNQNANPYFNKPQNQGYNNYQQGMGQSYPSYQQDMNQGYPMSNSMGYPAQSYVPKPQPKLNNTGYNQYSTNPYQVPNKGYSNSYSNGPNNNW